MVQFFTIHIFFTTYTALDAKFPEIHWLGRSTEIALRPSGIILASLSSTILWRYPSRSFWIHSSGIYLGRSPEILDFHTVLDPLIPRSPHTFAVVAHYSKKFANYCDPAHQLRWNAENSVFLDCIVVVHIWNHLSRLRAIYNWCIRYLTVQLYDEG